MNMRLRMTIKLIIFSALLTTIGCNIEPANNTNSATASNTNTAMPPAASETAPKAAGNWAVTLPVLDAFFADETFADELKSKLQLTDQQISKLRMISHQATARLRQSGRENTADYVSATELREKAEREISAVIGQDKVAQLFNLVATRWSGSDADAENGGGAFISLMPAGVPSDTRIVVNDPAFRMDVFENGQLIKSYKVGIGYPEFPLPTGLRKADQIIFNPTWTPPDEPWVESSRKVEAGKTIEAGNRLNPLGRLKIPIGLPSLIHGGKSESQIGSFASHGCVGLTDLQAIDFAKQLAQLGGVELTDEQIDKYGKNKSETKVIKLTNPVPIELRYETITVEDGKLHIYRDVYDRDTNTEENLRAVLEAYGVALDQLSEKEMEEVMDALDQMSRDASGRQTSPDQTNANSNTSSSKKSSDSRNNSSGKVTRTVKGQKEVVVEIAALQGKGYPAPVDIDTGNSRSKRASTRR